MTSESKTEKTLLGGAWLARARECEVYHCPQYKNTHVSKQVHHYLIPFYFRFTNYDFRSFFSVFDRIFTFFRSYFFVVFSYENELLMPKEIVFISVISHGKSRQISKNPRLRREMSFNLMSFSAFGRKSLFVVIFRSFLFRSFYLRK